MLVSRMIVGTLFTLLVVPSIYMLVARKRAAAASAEAVKAESGLHSSQFHGSAVEQSAVHETPHA